MINEKDFQRIKEEFDLFETQREILVKKSRDILRLSKQAIYCVHKNDMEGAENRLKLTETEISESRKMFKKNPKLDSIGQMSAAMQEYCEAKCYYGFVKERKIPSQKTLNIDVEDYLLGLCDLTGELGRRTVISVINGNEEEAYIIRDVVDKIFGHFLDLHLRNGELRKKSDSIKWNLKKIESVIYDLKTRREHDDS